jgi:hypothetical protein
MKKKIIISLGLVSVVALVFIVVIVLQHPTTGPATSPSPSSTPLGTANPQSSAGLPDDAKYGQALTTLSQQYPWYPKLPIETKDYRIVYDFDKNMFRIRILSTTAISDEIESFTQSALSDLKNIGVSEPIKYYVLDVNGNQL